MTLGEIIKTHRLRLGLSQRELGERVGVNKAAVQKWESGAVQNIKKHTIIQLSEIFGISPNELFNYSVTNAVPEVDRKEATRKYLNSLGYDLIYVNAEEIDGELQEVEYNTALPPNKKRLPKITRNGISIIITTEELKTLEDTMENMVGYAIDQLFKSKGVIE